MFKQNKVTPGNCQSKVKDADLENQQGANLAKSDSENSYLDLEQNLDS